MSSYRGNGLVAARAGLVVGLSLAVFAAGCGGSWRLSGTTVLSSSDRVRGGGVADGELQTDGEVTDTGAVRMALSVRGQCYNLVETRQRVKLREYQRGKSGGGPSGLSIVAVVFGAVGFAAGLPLTLASDTKYWPMIPGGIVLYVVGLVGMLNKSGRRSRYRTRTVTRSAGTRRVPVACSPALARKAERRMPRDYLLTTPWGQTVAGRRSAANVEFVVDWRGAGINPMQPDYAKLTRGWRVEDRSRRHVMEWVPRRNDLDAMIRAAGVATGTDITVKAGDAPPMVSVSSFSVNPPLTAGRTSTMTLVLTNGGSGSAYRFAARTKSSHTSLHGVSFPFGRIPPGATVKRRAKVTMPRDDDGGDALVLLDFKEANRNAPERYSKSFPIAGAKRPSLVVKCGFQRGVDSSNPRRLVADAGRQVVLRCTVGNRGVGRAVGTTVRASLAGQPAKVSQAKSIRPHARGVFDLILRVPRKAKLGQAMELRIEASETSFNVATRQSMWLYVGKPAICTGTISRATFDRKMRILRTQLANKDITRKQFKDYEAQLVGCLP